MKTPSISSGFFCLAFLLPLALAVQFITFPDAAPLPYVVHQPLAPSTATLHPTILSLHGNGSRGDARQLTEQTTWDGLGWALLQYDADPTGWRKVLAEEWVVIMPHLGPGSVLWDASDVLAVLEDAQIRNLSIDPSRLSIAGYSIGAAASYRTAFLAPGTFASIIASGGGVNFSSLQLSTLLSASSPTSLFAIGGVDDEKDPYTEISATVEQYNALAAEQGKVVNATFELAEGDHHFISQDPWVADAMWEWLTKQQKAAVQPGFNSTTTGSSVAIHTSSPVGTSSPGVAKAPSSATGASSTVGAAASATVTGGAGQQFRLGWW